MNRPRSTQVPVLLPLLLSAGLFLTPGPATGQVIRGMVIDALQRMPIPGANIQLRPEHGGAELRATTDSLGLFVLSPRRAGLYTLQATHLAYLRHDADTVRVGEGESVSIEIRMDPNVVPLEPLVVTARSASWPEGFEARRSAGFGRFLTRSDIEGRGASTITELLRAMPGLAITPQRRHSGSQLLMHGTSGLCQPAVWIDGLYVAQFTGSNVDDLLPPTVLQAVEVYNSVSTAPLQYRTGTCGVVLFWTRRGAAEEGGTRRWWKVAMGVGAATLFILLLR